MSVTRAQVKAARALLGVNALQLAELAGIGVVTLRRFEAGSTIDQSSMDAISSALGRNGILLIQNRSKLDGRTIGLGVAFKKSVTSDGD